jgi:hypothetical protein
MKKLKAFLLIIAPIALGVFVFTVSGVYIEIAIKRGFDVANAWFMDGAVFRIYPGQMSTKFGITPHGIHGNHIGCMIGLIAGYIFFKKIVMEKFHLLSETDLDDLFKR